MNQTQKDFILDRLIPFILREEGRGFDMHRWAAYPYGGRYRNYNDHSSTETPACGTVACIGGSLQILLNIDRRTGDFVPFQEATGLDRHELRGLFYGYTLLQQTERCLWPEEHITRLRKALTPLERAQVAADLLREVVRTEGKCLHRSQQATS